MASFIRWPGLIAFFVFTGGLTAIVLIFLDLWIKLAVIQGLEQTTGAEVNITGVSHTFSPLAISLKQVQITDAKQPEFNQVQAEQVQAQIDLAPLMRRKVIIETLTVNGLQFNQPRKSPGEVYRPPVIFSADSLSQLMPESPELPDIDNMLAKTPLKTTQAANEVRLAYTRHNDELTRQYQQLPNREKILDYQNRIKQITATDYKDPIQFASAKKEFDQLHRELKQDKGKLTAFKSKVSLAQKELTVKLTQLRKAPEQDYEQLQALVSGDATAIKNITGLVFGERVAKWSDYLLSTYQVLAPMLNKPRQEQKKTAFNQGKKIAFSDSSSLPDFLIKTANISLSWQDEVIDSHWQNITHQHDKIVQPTRFTVSAASSKLWQSLQLEGDFWLTENQVKASQNWDLQGVMLNGLALVEEEKLTGAIKQGLLSSSGAISINENQISGSADINLNELVVAARGGDSLTNTVAGTLNQLTRLSINTRVSGSFQEPKLHSSSDLDKQIANAVLANLGPERQAKLKELKQKLTARSQGPLADGQANISQWLGWSQLGDSSLEKIQEMLGTRLSSPKGKDKLKGLFKDKIFNG
ncbi:TIGR03545 family protein [Thalassomonas viridans]|uniref:TIGR03545 family protein n=1 Tax=Thalassomonas viridans TaxID=137584 RepID=A0AAE9YZ19_9GAMM|nr:TIGR03545 family protein [Thalassomonas viridans]WDE03821.1 TIGR03545 family protein [Thalassomonas viridans]